MINEVRHLKDVELALSDKERKHLILTGKNGSGKTSVLEYMTKLLEIDKKGAFTFNRISNTNSKKDNIWFKYSIDNKEAIKHIFKSRQSKENN